jgi:hypothetical protein
VRRSKRGWPGQARPDNKRIPRRTIACERPDDAYTILP